DQLEGLHKGGVKKSQNMAEGHKSQLSQYTEKRKDRDEKIWNALPPLNIHIQIHNQIKAFMKPPAEAAIPRWRTKAFEALIDKRNGRYVYYNEPRHTFDPLDLIVRETGEEFSQLELLDHKPTPGKYGDDGTGIFLKKSDFPSLPHDIYYTPVAELMGGRYLLFANAVYDSKGSNRGLKLAKQYFEKGDPEIGHDGALALVRLAYDWPALEMNLHEIRLSTHSPDLEFNRDWSSKRNGKFFYSGWSGSNTVGLMTAYDQLYPYIKDNEIFAQAVSRFIPWVKTPEDVIGLLDRYLIFSSVRDFEKSIIRAASVIDTAAQVLGPSPASGHLFDLTRTYAKIYPYEGTYQELYASALSRSGSYHIASFLTYALGDAAGQVKKAEILRQAASLGVKLPMNLSDVSKYPKIKGASDFLVEMWTAGGFPFMVGDASGGPHTGLEAYKRLKMKKDAVLAAFNLTGDLRHAWILKNKLGVDREDISKAAEGMRDPVLHAESRVVADYAAFIEAGVDETDALEKTSLTMRLGIGQGHAHADALDLNIFAMGLPMAVDLACRSEGANWSRPSASWAFLHNAAIAHDSDNPKTVTLRTEPWLHTFAPPFIEGRYTTAPQGKDGKIVSNKRQVLMMQAGSTGTYYAVDVQRLSGGKMHTWSFHGAESKTVEINTALEDKVERWTDRLLPGTQKKGTSPEILKAVWTMTREAGEYPHKFSGGGVIKTVAAEQRVLGKRYDENLPPARIRAWLLGHKGEVVYSGSPYSQNYHYAFPFLWVQNKEAPEVSTYPAIYEWYRGDKAVVASAELLSSSPLKFRVILSNGQVDTYTSTPDSFAAVSRNADGSLRWCKVIGMKDFKDDDLQISGGIADFNVKITEMNYAERKLTVESPLPENPAVVIGNDLRKCFLQLTGKGTEFTWEDDLLCHEGKITKFSVAGKDSINLETNIKLFHAGAGNREPRGFSVVNEDYSWAFRGGKVINKPEGAQLDDTVFKDSNNDGFINAKTYEAGVGDAVYLPVTIEVSQQADNTYSMKSSSDVTVKVAEEAVR
ncbi:MAG: hypothetical protein ACYTFY_09395, partial [Planctomycetota bacterium]